MAFSDKELSMKSQAVNSNGQVFNVDSNVFLIDRKTKNHHVAVIKSFYVDSNGNAAAFCYLATRADPKTAAFVINDFPYFDAPGENV